MLQSQRDTFLKTTNPEYSTVPRVPLWVTTSCDHSIHVQEAHGSSCMDAVMDSDQFQWILNTLSRKNKNTSKK